VCGGGGGVKPPQAWLVQSLHCCPNVFPTQNHDSGIASLHGCSAKMAAFACNYSNFLLWPLRTSWNGCTDISWYTCRGGYYNVLAEEPVPSQNDEQSHSERALQQPFQAPTLMNQAGAYFPADVHELEEIKARLERLLPPDSASI